MKITLLLFAFVLFLCGWKVKTPPAKPKNIIFILADDHRYDFMGFMNKYLVCRRLIWIGLPEKVHIFRMLL